MSPVQSAGAARRWAIGLLVCVAAAGGCNSNATLVQPPSFNRPGQMVLTCYDTVAKHVVPADRCDGVEGKSSETVVLTAVVTQTARGELGAVDLRDDVPLDSDPVVPGFTFRRVGESPTGLAIDPAHPEVVFVASFGARGVQALSTSELIPGSKGVSLPSAFVPLSDAPTDLVLSPDGSTLYAGLADTPALAAIPVEREQTGDTLTAVRFGTPRIIPLGDDVPAPVAPAPDDPVSDYSRTCTRSPVPVESVATTTPRPPEATGPARAGRLTIDTASSPAVLLVPDEGLPVVHRFALDAAGDATELDPITVSVPTRAVAVTPPVPSEVGAPAGTERYLYAIDATDRSVLAVDYDASSPTFGAVLPVNVGDDPSDRIRIDARAVSLAVVTPDKPDENAPALHPGAYCDPADPQQAKAASGVRLRGVFLAVGLQNGQLAIVDVHDLDAPCRGGAGCEDPAVQLDREVRIRRNRVRVASFSNELVHVASVPGFRFAGAVGRLDESGVPTSGDGPGLMPVGCALADAASCPSGERVGCPDGMVQAFPVLDLDEPLAAKAPLICALDDVWGARRQRWSAMWQGALPDTQGGAGRFTDGAGFSVRDAGLCGEGVVGADDVVASALPADDPVAGYGGDELVLVGNVPARRRDARAFPECQRFVIPDNDPDGLRDVPIGFTIKAAFDDALELGDAIDGGDYTLGDVRGCFPDLVAYEIRAHDAYTVVGSASGFSHRVAADPLTGACRVDTTRPREDAGRAFGGRPFDNGVVAFTIGEYDDPDSGPTPTLPAGVEAQLAFDLTGLPQRLVTGTQAGGVLSSIGVLPQRLVYSPYDQDLYVVDIQAEWVRRIELNPFLPASTIR
ncbi:MAG: hypothetical protein KC543_07875 [Myxococcales bacterium]|nr:hypothetical protein [Myxococcales bacterium]